MKIRKEIDVFGDICYYNENNELHREDGPAIEYITGYRVWYKNNRRHRLDGPAYISYNGYQEWYIDGKRIIVESQKEFERYMKLIAFI